MMNVYLQQQENRNYERKNQRNEEKEGNRNILGGNKQEFPKLMTDNKLQIQKTRT